jgi:hypothetical protein
MLGLIPASRLRSVHVHQNRRIVEIEKEMENFNDASPAFIALALRHDFSVCRFYVPIKLAVLFLTILEAKLFWFHVRVRNEYAGLRWVNAKYLRMDQGEQIEAFAHELDMLVDRFCDEYDLPYASVVGVMHFKTKLLMDDWENSEGEKATD